MHLSRGMIRRCQRLFDETYNHELGESSGHSDWKQKTGYLTALADVMGITYDQATIAADKRKRRRENNDATRLLLFRFEQTQRFIAAHRRVS